MGLYGGGGCGEAVYVLGVAPGGIVPGVSGLYGVGAGGVGVVVEFDSVCWILGGVVLIGNNFGVVCTISFGPSEGDSVWRIFLCGKVGWWFRMYCDGGILVKLGWFVYTIANCGSICYL